MTPLSPQAARLLGHTLLDGGLAGALSTVVMAWRGRRDSGRATAALNAPSHWLWGDEALRNDRADLRHTATGQLIHHASSLLWAGLYSWLQQRRQRPTPLDALTDAAVVTTLAAVVDLKLTPRRFTPGFERRLSRSGLALVYAGFGLGLALGGLAVLRGRPPRGDHDHRST
jgi:hypothetical protein